MKGDLVQNALDAAAKAADYLYDIDTKGEDVPHEIIAAIGHLRQMINEEFVHRDKAVSSQLIFDLIYPALENYINVVETSKRRSK